MNCRHSVFILALVGITSSCVTQQNVLNKEHNVKYTNKIISKICKEEVGIKTSIDPSYYDPNIILTDSITDIKTSRMFAYGYTPNELKMINKSYGKVDINSCFTDSIQISKSNIKQFGKKNPVVRFSPLIKTSVTNNYKFLVKYYYYQDAKKPNSGMITYIIAEYFFKINRLGNIKALGEVETFSGSYWVN